MRCFLLLLLLFAGNAAFAQARSPVSRPDSAVAGALGPAAPDTLAAIHELFATRRRQQTFGALGIVVATGAAIAFISASAHSSGSGGGGAYGINFPGPGNDDSNITSLGVGILAIPTLAGELLFFDRYNRKHERQAVKDCRAHKLPKPLIKKLKPKYFRL